VTVLKERISLVVLMLTNVLWELMNVVLTLSVTILKEVSLALVTLVSLELLLMDVLISMNVQKL